MMLAKAGGRRQEAGGRRKKEEGINLNLYSLYLQPVFLVVNLDTNSSKFRNTNHCICSLIYSCLNQDIYLCTN
jgi:hypothetical protein